MFYYLKLKKLSTQIKEIFMSGIDENVFALSHKDLRLTTCTCISDDIQCVPCNLHYSTYQLARLLQCALDHEDAHKGT